MKSNVRKLMAQAGIANAFQLKKKSGVSYATAYRLVNGEGLPSRSSTIEKLCKAFGCTPGDLFA